MGYFFLSYRYIFELFGRAYIVRFFPLILIGTPSFSNTTLPLYSSVLFSDNFKVEYGRDDTDFSQNRNFSLIYVEERVSLRNIYCLFSDGDKIYLSLIYFFPVCRDDTGATRNERDPA